MGEDKDKIQQPDPAQGKDKFETIGTLLSVVALSIFFGFILMAIATTVENSAKSILSIISSIMFTIAAIVIIIDTIIKHILHQKSVKKIVLSVFAMLFTALCTGILIVSGINTVYTTEILSHIVYWLVAAVMIVVSIAVITLQFLINKNDFEQNPIKSYAVIILTMLYALTYAMIVKPDIVFNIAFTIHTMASLIVFINIIFKTGIKSKNIIQLALFVIAVLALMAQMIYSIYIWFFNAEYPDLFNAIMGVFAGLLGGVLTLTGVAWTIKRQDDIRKEDEKRKAKPYLRLLDRYSEGKSLCKLKWSDFEKTQWIENTLTIDEYLTLRNNKNRLIAIKEFKIELLSDNLCKIIGFEINNTRLNLNNVKILIKNNIILFCLTDIIEVSEIRNVNIIACDKCDRLYGYKVELEFDETKRFEREKVKNVENDSAYFEDDLSYNVYKIVDIGMPEEIEKEGR